jgi:hypothetical protein
LVFGRAAFFAETAFLAGAVLGTLPLGVVPFTAGTAATFRAAFFAAFFVFAQRAFWAIAILARASALKLRTALVLLGNLVPAGRPGFRFAVISVPLKSALACCSREISASISKTMSFVSMNPPLSRVTYELIHHGIVRMIGEAIESRRDEMYRAQLPTQDAHHRDSPVCEDRECITVAKLTGPFAAMLAHEATQFNRRFSNAI